MDRILMGFDNLFNFSLRNSVLLRATLCNSPARPVRRVFHKEPQRKRKVPQRFNTGDD
jgi:hypothetical protein